jgi:MGT family glycosyltransferase
LVRMLISRGHEVCWYSGKHYKQIIETSGARFFPFDKAKDFHDSTIKTEFPDLPQNSLLKHASYYIRHVFYDNMSLQYDDLCEILKVFSADLLLTDEWFTGAIPLAEKKILPWVCYCNSPLFYYSDEVPFPGAGIFPSTNIFGINRNRMVNWMVTKIFFAKTQKYIDVLRKKLGLQPMPNFFIINNIFLSQLFIKFNTLAFEFKWKELPQSIRFVGPVVPMHSDHINYNWQSILATEKPVIFITQGTVNINNYNNLIIPALKALKGKDVILIVATGNSAIDELVKEFASETVVIEKYIPYEYILPHADIVITNGGFGGVITSLSHGVPMVVAGNSEDKPEIAARIKYCKVGINLKTGHPRPNQIKRAVYEILSNPLYKNNAIRISEDFKTHNAPLEACKLIEGILKQDVL